MQSNIASFESSSAVSDAAGNLLFYTMGSRIWDKNGNEMPNSNGLFGNGPLLNGVPAGSSANGVAIIKNPGNLNQYYVFSGDAHEDTIHKLYYSLIDMTLNNGLGDVVPFVKNVVLMNDISEQICATNGSDCKSSWLIARDKTSHSYHAFKIDVNGVNPVPVITPASGNIITPLSSYNLTFASDGVTAASGGGCLTIEKFNNVTGVFSDFILLDVFLPYGTYNPEFSPDGSKLYYIYHGTVTTSQSIKQLDLSLLPDIQAVVNSVTTIELSYPLSPIPYTMALRRAPDEKIYTLTYTWNGSATEYIGRIENPNITGVGCNFVPVVFTAQSANPFNSLGAPVFVKSSDTIFHQIDTFLCDGASIQLSSSVDSVHYNWNNGINTTQRITIQTPGTYWVNATSNGCTNILDSFHVSQRSFKIELSNDTIICKGDSIRLNATLSDLDSKLLWNTGESSSSILIDTQGIYHIKAENVCGTFTDSVKVDVTGCYCVPFLPTAFSPNGDLLNDDFGPLFDCGNISDYNFSIYNRFGQRVFISNDPDGKWDGSFKGNRADIGTYFYYLTFKKQRKNIVSYKGNVVLIR